MSSFVAVVAKRMHFLATFMISTFFSSRRSDLSGEELGKFAEASAKAWVRFFEVINADLILVALLREYLVNGFPAIFVLLLLF